MDGRIFNCFNLKTIFNSFCLLDVVLGHALAAVTPSTLVNLFACSQQVNLLAHLFSIEVRGYGGHTAGNLAGGGRSALHQRREQSCNKGEERPII